MCLTEFRIIAEALEGIEKTSSRDMKTTLLANLIKATPKEVIDKVVYFILGKIWPEWMGMPEIGVDEELLIKTIAKATGLKEANVDKMFRELGDPGLVIEDLKKREKASARDLTKFLGGGAAASSLSVEKVYDTLSKAALASGEGSRSLKINLIAGLLKEASPLEARYVARFVTGDMRTGIQDMTVIDALAIVFGGSKEYESIIEKAYYVRAGDLGLVARILAHQGLEAVRRIKPEAGIPIKPMLANRESDPKTILDKVGGKAVVEYKYDGERGQIHKKKDEVKIFSRNLEDITHQYPDVAELARRCILSDEAIVEGEMVAIDPDTGLLMPFQELMHRKRKHDIREAVKGIPVSVYVFDVMYNGGEDLLDKPLPYRREVLKRVIKETESFKIAHHMITDDPQRLEEFFLKAIEEGAEGVMVKAIHDNSIYQAGARGWLWIKYKRDYKSEMTDTVDLVVVGAFAGRGRRSGRFGALLMAAYDEETDSFRTVCKVGTGFTDKDLEEITEMLKPHVVSYRPSNVDSEVEPDVWVTPHHVAEIIGAELTLSPAHTCCRDAIRKGVGISIRFPRFIRWRPEKTPRDATTTKEFLEMYRRQLKKIEEPRA